LKRLIIAPHVDDDVLGCGGILDKSCHVVYCGLDETGLEDRPTMGDRLKEINDVQSITGHSFDVLNNLVNRYDEFKLIGQLENAINTIKPKEVYVCHPSYNQDHKSVYNASMIALRPHDTNYFVPKVFLYEQPQVYFWNTTDRDFQANYFVGIDIDKKIKVYETMKSQVRSFRSSEHIRANSKIRGGQSNHEYAEAFEILRWVDG
jgi:LmbE family N-acetylglucosaminyl deacetylase